MTSTTKSHVSLEESPQSLADTYSHDLQMYQNVPFGDTTLQELRETCETRLKVLTLVERVHLRKSTTSVSQRNTALVAALRAEGLNDFARLISSPGCRSHTEVDIRARRSDHVSHFVLRSAVAFNVLKKRWFFKQEARLFKWRCSSLDNEGTRRFMSFNNFHFTPISQTEKRDLAEHLQTCSPEFSDIDSTQFYRVPFPHVISLVKKRKVLVMNGEALVPEAEMLYLFVSYFRRVLTSGFELAREARANLYNDERFVRIFAHLEDSIHIENTMLIRELEIQQHVKLDRLDELSETAYPLCMRVLHKALRKTHHLTHGGRVQYGLFLKGMGITLSDAMTFWKSEFTKIMNEAAFNREHSYQIRFAFGWEGSRRDYQPYTCAKIQEAVVSARDYHGCPFKHMRHDVLEDELAVCGFNALERSAIMDLSMNGQYSAACNKYYELKHGCFNDTLFKHPNIYFNESVKHIVHVHDADPETEDGY